MAKAILVRRTDPEIQGLVMEALSRTQMPVTFCDWNYVEQLDETQLIIATPWYDSKGPRTAYSAVIDALQGAGIYEEIPLRRVYLKSPSDLLVKMMEREAQEAPDEGFLNLLHHKDGSYSVVFAPLTGLSGSGSPVPARHFSESDEAGQFLLNELHLSPRDVEKAFLEARQHRIGSIVTRLTESQLRRSGLAPPRTQSKTGNPPRRGMKSNGNGNGSGNSHRQSRGSHRTRRGGSV